MAAFRSALVLDIREHRLAWSTIVAGLIAGAMLWGSILGAPLARPLIDENFVPPDHLVTEQPFQFGSPE